MAAWSEHELAEANKEDLHISAPNEDGTLHTPTWIWMVEVDSELYCRSYNGENGRWYTAAKRAGSGFAKFGDVERAVRFEFIQDEAVNSALDQAYKIKYVGSPYLDGPINEPMRSATVKLVPTE